MNVALQIDDQGHPTDYESLSSGFQMVCTSFPNELSLIPSSPMWDLPLKTLLSLYQQNAHSDSMPS
ncbi:LOW QUALITY PROTEIN: hypothetical protein ACHAW6_001900 [Cyclotella cf. meneghiniana]